jgi:hypothetical protein
MVLRVVLSRKAPDTEAVVLPLLPRCRRCAMGRDTFPSRRETQGGSISGQNMRHAGLTSTSRTTGLLARRSLQASRSDSSRTESARYEVLALPIRKRSFEIPRARWSRTRAAGRPVRRAITTVGSSSR